MSRTTTKWDVETLRASVARVEVIRAMAPEPKIGAPVDRATQAAYYAGWDDCCAVIDKLLRKMTEVHS